MENLFDSLILDPRFVVSDCAYQHSPHAALMLNNVHWDHPQHKPHGSNIE